MARTHIDQRARARRAWPRLVDVSRRRGRITYGALAAALGLHHRAASWFLGEIQRYCRDQGLPPLQALAVNRRTKLPGTGYVASARSGAAYQRALDRVYVFRRPKRAPF